MRMKICSRCGKPFEADTYAKIVCPECSKIIRSETVLQPKICTACGAKFIGYPASKYCESCRGVAKKIAKKEYKERKRLGTSRSIGSIDICKSCGKPYTVDGALQKYCKDCAAIEVKRNADAHKREWMNSYRPEHPKKKIPKVCTICGKEFFSDRPRVTCSDACDKERLRRTRQRVEANRVRPEPTAENIAAGKALAAFRKSTGLSQREFAQKLGIIQTRIAKYERGNFAISAEVLEKIKEVFGVQLL